MKEFVFDFLKDRGMPLKDFSFYPIAPDGSTRNFWRVLSADSGISYIAMENRPDTPFLKRENLATLRIGEHLFRVGLPVPKIYRSDLRNGRFVMEDMGETSLQEEVRQRDDPLPLYEKVVEILFRLQVEGAKGFDTAWTCQTERYDRRVMRRYESDYFKEAYLSGFLGLKEGLSELEASFDHLVERASHADGPFFLHRDFQSRNIMVSVGKIGILDWQGGRLGPLAYDLASLLIDPYTSLSSRVKDHVFRCYLGLLRDHQPNLVKSFKSVFPYLAIQRNLQIVGAFSFLSKVRGKHRFEAYIPPALRSLHLLLADVNDPELSPLTDLLDSLPSVIRAS